MAAATVVLSSSPSRSPIVVTPTHRNAAAMSSSPGLPSPSQLLSGMPSQLFGGSRAAPIPKDVVAGFASASSLLRQARLQEKPGDDDGSMECQLVRPSKSAESDKVQLNGQKDRVAVFRVPNAMLHQYLDSPGEGPAGVECSRIDHESPGKGLSAPKLPRRNGVAGSHKLSKKKDTTVLGVQENVGKAGRVSATESVKNSGTIAPTKPRRKKSEGGEDGQTTIKKGKVTKPGSSKSVSKPKKTPTTAKKTKAVAAETFNTLLGTQEEEAKAREEFRDLCAEKAIPIRRGWTPCKDTPQDQAVTADVSSPSKSAILLDAETVNGTGPARFGQLFDDFGFAKAENSMVRPAILRQESGESFVKRRKIELLNGVSVPPQIEKQKKTRSPKKKPQTITEKATAPFVTVDALNTPSLLQYFDSSTVSEALTSGTCDKSGSATATMRPPTKKVSKSKTAVSKLKKLAPSTLLSPESAMKNARDQDLVFGTSSQLAREESPTVIKELQQAIEQSAALSQESEASIVPVGKFRTSNSLAVARPRNLWTVASRDLEGSLLEADIVDLTETPKPLKTKVELACSEPPAIREDQPSCRDQQRSDNATTTVTPQINLNTTTILQQQVQEPNSTMIKSVAEATLKKRPKKRSPTKNATNPKTDPNQMPNYQGFTDAQLAREVAAYGFKSIKKRVAMITLLEQCWQSKISLALEEVQANLNQLQPASVAGDVEKTADTSAKKRGRPRKSTTDANATISDASPKKPRGRPKKDASATTPPPKRKRKAKSPARKISKALVGTDDEIYDSNPPTPSPPRRRASSKSPAQLRLSQSMGATVKARSIADDEHKQRLFAHMTKAITTFPPTNDIKHLTFHERILMYEPIVLEDLAVWLNTQGLATIGEDDEVGPVLVKEWCEERSVCCLWRENLRGGARGRW